MSDVFSKKVVWSGVIELDYLKLYEEFKANHMNDYKLDSISGHTLDSSKSS
jgi:hypothetical protein